jgi:hypothetical protein
VLLLIKVSGSDDTTDRPMPPAPACPDRADFIILTGHMAMTPR